MKRLFFIPLLLVCLFAFPLVMAGEVSYYDFSSVTDLWGSNDGTNSGASSIADYPSFDISGDSSPNSYDFDGVNDNVVLGSFTGVKSWSFWFKPDNTITTSANYNGLMSFDTTDIYQSIALGPLTGSYDNELISVCSGPTPNIRCFYWTNTDLGISEWSSANWYNLVLVWDGTSNYNLFVNGVDKSSGNKWNTPTEINIWDNSAMGVGFGDYFDGKIDEVQIFDSALTEEEVENIYNYGNYDGLPSTFEISAVDFYDSSSISSFWADIDGVGNFSTTNGTIVSSLLQNDTDTYVIDVGSANYFTRSYEAYDVSSNLEAELYSSDIKFRAFELITGDELEANFTIDSVKKGSNESFYLSVDEYTVLVESSGYYSLNYSFNVTARQNETLNVYNLSNAKYTVVPRDVLSNVSLSNFTISLSNSTYNFSEVVSGVVNATFNVNDGFYFLEVSGGGRVSYNDTVYVNTSDSVEYVYLYALNSLWVKAYSQETSSQILVFNVTVQNDNYSYSNSTSSGTVYVNDIMSGSYDVTIVADGFSVGTYTVSITNNSHSDLNAFLSASTDNFIFTVKDKSTNGLLEGATITQKRFVNGSLVTVESKDTDITGRVQFTYTTGVEYTFIATKTDYVAKSFPLTVLFDNYNLLLTPELSSNPDVFLDDVFKYVVDYNFINGTSWVRVGFDSPEGSLNSYSVNLSVDGVGYSYVADSNSVGSIINASLSTPLINYGDKALVTVKYLSSFNSGVKVFTYTYTFTDWIPEDGTVKNFIGELDSYSDVEVVFWATIVYFLVVGIFSLIGLLVNESLLFGSVGGVITTVLLLFGGFVSGVVGGMVLFIFVSLIVGRLISNG